MSQTQTPEKTMTPSISNKPNSKTPMLISTSSSTFLFSLISVSLLSFSLFFLSFKDTTFWFVLSNAIIFLIAAADFDTFSPSKPKPDVYDEYLKNVRPRNTYAYTYCTSEPLDSDSRCRRDVVKENVTSPETEIVLEKRELVLHPVTEKRVGEKYSRSQSEKAIVAVGDKKKVLSRSSTGNEGPTSEGDLSAMSDEELNRRVEEFIKRINREIRLPEMRDQTENE